MVSLYTMKEKIALGNIQCCQQKVQFYLCHGCKKGLYPGKIDLNFRNFVANELPTQ